MSMNETLRGMIEIYNKTTDGAFETDYIEDDPITHVLTYFKIGADLKRKGKGIPRLLYDADAIYFNSQLKDPVAALFGDTMISFFTPYREALTRAGKVSSVTGKPYGKNYLDLCELLKNKDDTGYKDVNDNFRPFAEVYHTKGNFLFLPARKMNNDRYSYTRDRIDKSLHECFPGGALSKYFRSENEKLFEWIKKEKLDTELLFTDGVINKDSIVPLTGVDLQMNYFEMAKRGVLSKYIHNVIELIEERNRTIDEKVRASYLFTLRPTS